MKRKIDRSAFTSSLIPPPSSLLSQVVLQIYQRRHEDLMASCRRLGARASPSTTLRVSLEDLLAANVQSYAFLLRLALRLPARDFLLGL